MGLKKKLKILEKKLKILEKKVDDSYRIWYNAIMNKKTLTILEFNQMRNEMESWNELDQIHNPTKVGNMVHFEVSDYYLSAADDMIDHLRANN